MRSYTVLLAVLITAAQAQEEPLPPTNLPLLDDAVEQCSHSGALECYALLAEVAVHGVREEHRSQLVETRRRATELVPKLQQRDGQEACRQ